jgi:hypothetical protein
MSTQNFLGGKTPSGGFQNASLFGQQQGLGQPSTAFGGSTQSTFNKPQGTSTFSTTPGTTSGFFNQPSTGTVGTGGTGQITSNPSQQQSTTGGFGLGQTQPQPGGTGLFGGPKPATSGFGTQSGLFGGPSTTQSAQPFGQQMQFGQPTQQTGIQQGMQSGVGMPSFPQRQISPQVFSLMPNNFMKLDKVETLPEDIQKIVKEIENSLRVYDIQLDYSSSVINTLYDNYKFLSAEGVKAIKFSKLINTKKSKINFLLQNLKLDINQQKILLEKGTRDYHIIVEHPNMKIQVPSDYFSLLNKELEEKISLQIQQISDLEALVNLHYRKEFGSFQINSDLVEQTIREMYVSLIGLVTEAARIKEYINLLKQKYFELMRYHYGWNEYDLEKRLRQALIVQDEKEIFSRVNL